MRFILILTLVAVAPAVALYLILIRRATPKENSVRIARDASGKPLHCPRCSSVMQFIAIGKLRFNTCVKCGYEPS